jgi:F0F1-type ATP synthase delta subunit
MPRKNMYSEMAGLARVEEERETLKEELETLLNSLYEKEGAFEETLAKKISPATSEVVKKLIAEGRVPDKAKFIQEVLKALDSLEVLELSVAFIPKGQTIERLWQWVRRNLGEGIILKFNLDRSIGAGAIIVYKGKFKNYSLQKLLQNYFAASKDNLMQILA